jgi:hypothetical protein
LDQSFDEVLIQIRASAQVDVSSRDIFAETVPVPTPFQDHHEATQAFTGPSDESSKDDSASTRTSAVREAAASLKISQLM